MLLRQSCAGQSERTTKQMPSHIRLAHLLFPIISDSLPIVNCFVTVLRILPYMVVDIRLPCM